MSKATNEEMKQEALNRIKTLVDNVGLNPMVFSYFNEDRLYYSYLTGGGFIGSIDTVSYDPLYEKTVKNFEKMYDVLVYHCVESDTSFGKTLIMLFVSRDKASWEQQRPSASGIVSANVYNIEEDFDEIGDVKFKSYQGALVRIS